MIEAVNSVLSSAQMLRGNAEQVSAAAPIAIEIDAKGAVDVPKAPFISPYISIDIATRKAVLQIRDSDTGDVVRQFPTERSLQLRRAAAVEQEAAAEARKSGDSVASRDSGAPVATDVPAPAEYDGGGDVAQAQAASQALSTGAQAGAQMQSAGVSVLA